MTKPRLVLVAPDALLLNTLGRALEQANYMMCDDGPDLIVLAVATLAPDAIEQLRARRWFEQAPLLVWLQQPGDVAAVLRMGADDCVRPATSMAEVLARLEALYRRAKRLSGSNELAFGDVKLNLQRRSADRGFGEVALTPKEIRLLAYLASRAGLVVGREELLREVWDSPVGASRTVDTHMATLRKKLERDPRCPVRLITIRGRGYQFVA